MIHGYDYRRSPSRGCRPRADALFAPSVPHALHMPSHIYVLLGMWPDTVRGNVAAAAAEKARGNPDDHMHALDYSCTATYRWPRTSRPRRWWTRRAPSWPTSPRRSTTPAAHRALRHGRHRGALALERGQWRRRPPSTRGPIASRTRSRCLSRARHRAARTGNGARARADVDRLAALKDTMKDAYWAEQIEIQRRSAAAWAARARARPRKPSR